MDTNRSELANPPVGTDLRLESMPARVPRRRRRIRDRIIGGLILAMPLLLTLWIIGWLYSVLEQKLIEPVAAFVLWKIRWTTANAELPSWFEMYVAPLLAIALVVIILYCLDLFADTSLHRGVGWALKRVPFFSHIYNPIQGIFQSFEPAGAEPQPAKRMVLVTFPHPGVKLPAFVTGSCRDIHTHRIVLCVYVPTTPVPTTGFFLLVPEEEVTELNWNTEQTLQAVMSGGLACPREVSYFPGAAFAPSGSGAPAAESCLATGPQMLDHDGRHGQPR